MEILRGDSREIDALRPFVSEIGALNRTDGSARLSCGGASVIVGLYGPVAARFPHMEDPSKATVEVTVKPMTGTGSSSDRQIESAVSALVEASVVLEDHPRSMIVVVVQLLGEEGVLIPLALNATVMAMADACLPLRGLASAGSCAVTTLSDGKPHIVLDPSSEELIAADASASVCYLDDDVIWSSIEIASPAPGALEALFTAAKRASNATKAYITLALKRKVARDTQE